jgi:hypothetical protein
VDQSDTPPAGELVETFEGLCQDTHAAVARWNEVRTKDVPQFNAMLAEHQLAPLSVPKEALADPECGK